MIMPAPVWLRVIVDSSAPITINTQIAEQIKLLIAVGKLQSGDALPTVTQLAKQLGVNHNTIAAVYNYLIESGYLIAQRGKGTFVADTQAVQNIITHKEFYKLLDQAFSYATIIGLCVSEFAGGAYAQGVMSSQYTVNTLKLVFVDCLHNSADVYEAVQLEITQNVLLLYLEDIKVGKPEVLKDLLAADVVITTVQLLWEVTQIASSEQEVICVDIKPDVQLLTIISSLPRHTLILLVCEEETGSEEMKNMLKQAGISHVNFQTLGLENIKQNSQLLEQAFLVCVSKQVENYIRQSSSQLSKIMVFNFSLNETNISVLKARIAAIRSAKSSSYNNRLLE
jgi:DNA-binding transcriptional regulator YhcF (GntR family)